MERSEALRSIRYDLFEYIQKKVAVDFDNKSQSPVSFDFKGKSLLINEVLCSFRLNEEGNINSFLVSAEDGDIYLLYFHIVSRYPWEGLHAGFWVLGLRIFNDNELMAFYREDRKMLINMTLKRVINFHGHMCPDLILGSKVCEYAHKVLDSKNEFKKGLSIITENSTSAVDAIQVLLGATVGNQRLRIMDYGKHNYTIFYDKGRKGIRLTLRPRQYKDEEEYCDLVKKISENRAGLSEVVQFQKILDDRARLFIDLSPEDIFDIDDTAATEHPTEMADVYISCCRCGQHVLRSRIIDYQGESYCMPCFQTMGEGNNIYSLQ